MGEDKRAAYMTLFTALETLNRLAAPFVPFMAEEIYQNLVRSVDNSAALSVHLTDYPKAQYAFVDEALEANMQAVLEIVTLGRQARNSASIKNRQPLSCLYVQAEKELEKGYVEIVLDELNIKELCFVKDASSFISYKAKPQLKTLGPRYGRLLNAISEHLKGEGIGDEIVKAHKEDKQYIFRVSDVEVMLSADDVLIEPVEKAGFISATERELSVVLNTNLTPKLLDEGFVRELTSKLQMMRKEAGFDVTDHIIVSYSTNSRLEEILTRFGEEIAQDTLAKELKAKEPNGFIREWDINGEPVKFGIKKV